MTHLLDHIVTRAHSGGGWGYTPGQPMHIEPTCLALLALNANPTRYAQALAFGRNALRQHLRADGSYRLTRGRPQAIWPTALALFTLRALGDEPANLSRTIQFLLNEHGRPSKADPEFAVHIDINMKLIGWAWAEGNFSWVEPTSWACLALRHCGHGDNPRVLEGLRLLLDRAFPSGGINYGNRTVLGKSTEPIPGPTALMCLALQGVDHPLVRAAHDYLSQHARETTDLDHRSWALLARTTPDNENGELRAGIESAVAQPQSIPFLPRLALASLALGTANYHPFRLPTGSQVPVIPEQPPESVPDREPSRPLWGSLVSGVISVYVRGIDALRPLPECSAVHIAASADYGAGLLDVLRQQYEHFRKLVPLAGRRVVLKPNLVEYHRDKVINTKAEFVGAVIDLCRAEGAKEVIVAEGPGHWRNVEFLVNESGLGDVLRSRDVKFVDINHDEPVRLLNMGRLTGLDYLYMSKTVAEAEVFISLPKLKTHHWAGATLSLKNLFGTLPGTCYGWPKNELHWRGIPQSIIDIALTRTPDLAIVDGVVAMEGDGPLNGTAVPMGVVVMGADLVATDATCCRLMGLDPTRVPYLALGAEKKLGRISESEIPQIGDSLASRQRPFEMPPMIEKHLIPKKTSA